MAVPLTFDNFEFDKLRAKSPETKKGGNVIYYSIPFEYEDSKSSSKVEGNFRVFRHEKKERISYSLAIEIDDENEEFFTKLGERMAEITYKRKDKIPKSFKPSDLELVKTTASGKYENVYARIYTSKSGKVNCNLSEHKEVNGAYKRKIIDVNELVDETFKGSCALRIYRVYIRSSKTITLSVEEIMVTDLITKKSYLMNVRKLRVAMRIKILPISGGSRLGHRASGTQSKSPNLNENGQNPHFSRLRTQSKLSLDPPLPMVTFYSRL